MKSRFLHTVCIFPTCGILGRLCFLVCGWLSIWWPSWLWCMGDVGGFWRTECFVSSNKQFTTIICILSKVIHTCACLSVFNKWIAVFFLTDFLYNITAVFLITTDYYLNLIFCFIDFFLFFIFGILFERVWVTCWKSWFWRKLKPCLKCLQGQQQVRLPRHNIVYSAHSFSFLQHKSGCSARRHAWAEMLMAVGNTGYLVIVFCHPSFTPGVVSYTLPWTLARSAAYSL